MSSAVESDVAYGTLESSGSGRGGSHGDSETSPLLPVQNEAKMSTWKPLDREELEEVAGGPGWKMIRFCLHLCFWAACLTMLGIAMVLIIQKVQPAPDCLQWWQKEVFYRLRPAMFLNAEDTAAGAGAFRRVSQQLPHLRFLGFGVIILEGIFRHNVSMYNGMKIDQRYGTLPQFQQLLTDSHTAGLRVVLNLCELDVHKPPAISNKTSVSFNASDTLKNSLRFWLEQHVSGFEICNEDTAVSKEILKTWSELADGSSTGTNKRIVLVRETNCSHPGHSLSKQASNGSLVGLLLKSLLPPSSHPLSPPEVAEAIEFRLKTLHDQWPSWRVGGAVPSELQKIIMVLMMTLPGTPVISYGDEISQMANQNHLRSSTALFQSLCRTRSFEDGLLHGTYTFLSFNTTSSGLRSPLAFLRSWRCLQYLVVFNLSAQPHSLASEWFSDLPQGGMVVTSTGLNRFGYVTLQSIRLQPYEAVVIKLVDAGYNL